MPIGKTVINFARESKLLKRKDLYMSVCFINETLNVLLH